MWTTLLSFATAVLVVAAGLGREAGAAAQAGQAVRHRPATPGMLQLSLLAVKEVQGELKLSAEQVRKAREALEKYQEALAETQIPSADARDQAEAERRWRQLGDESEKAVATLLTPVQIKRLREIRLQQAGAVAVADPKLAAELKLTEDQRKALKVIAADQQAKFNAVGTDPTLAPREKAAKMVELTKMTDAAVRELLTADQRAQWERLIGKPFRFPDP